MYFAYLYVVVTFLGTAFGPRATLTGLIARIVASLRTWGARRRRVMPLPSQLESNTCVRASEPL